MSCQGVPDEVFMEKLRQATSRLNIKFMVDKMYYQVQKLCAEDFSEERKRDVMSKLKIFFGPSRQFTSVFKAAMLFSVE